MKLIFQLALLHLSVVVSILATKPNKNIAVWLTTPLDKAHLLSRQTDIEWKTDDGTAQHVIDVDDSVSYQEINGLGAVLSDSSAWLISNELTEKNRKSLITSLFDRRNGIGLSLIRLSVGASDFSVTNYTYDDSCCDLGNFTIGHDRQYIIPIIKSAMEKNQDLLTIALGSSPPPWMKTTKSLVGGQLDENQFSNFATYLARYVIEYKKVGVPIYAIVPQNEPFFSFPCCYPSMKLNAEEQAYLIDSKIGPVFKKYNIESKIIASSQSWEDLASYGVTVLNDEETKNYVAGVGFTCYRGSPIDQTAFHRKHPNQGLWLTECTDEVQNHEAGTFHGLFRRSINREIVGAFRNWANGVIKGNIVLNEKHGPQNGGCKNCYGMVTVSPDGRLVFNAAYYTFGHLSKFLRKGAKRILSTSFSKTLETVAFENKDGEKVLLVYNNLKEYPVPFKANWGKESFSYNIKPYAAVTFTWRGASESRSAFNRIEAESFTDSLGIVLQPCKDESGCGDNVGSSDSGDYLLYRNIDFGNGANSVSLRTASKKSGLIEIRLDGRDGTLVEVIRTDDTGDYQNWVTKSSSISTVKGLHDVYLMFRGDGGSLCNLNWFVFGGKMIQTRKEQSFDENGFYKIVAMHSNKVLDADDGQNNRVGTPIRQWEFYYVDWQKFKFIPSSNKDGCYKIFVKQSNLLLETLDDTNEDGATIQQGQDRNVVSQTWKLTRLEDGYSRIESCSNGKVMQIRGGEKENGAELQISEDKGKPEQKFSIVLMDVIEAEVDIAETDHRDRP